jgi:polygalacturonase
MWAIHPVLSENITIRGVRIESFGPNNDGCDPECSKNILIENCYFNTGDDCIVVKSGRNNDGIRFGIPSQNIIIKNCHMAEGHGGVVIGSEVSGNVRNIFAEDCIMNSPNLERAIRIKSNSKRGGIIENIYVRNITVKQVKEAVLKINLFYDVERDNNIPVVRNIYLENIESFNSIYGIWIKAYQEKPVENLNLINCSFKNVKKGNIIENVNNVNLENLKINDNPISGF